MLRSFPRVEEPLRDFYRDPQDDTSTFTSAELAALKEILDALTIVHQAALMLGGHPYASEFSLPFIEHRDQSDLKWKMFPRQNMQM